MVSFCDNRHGFQFLEKENNRSSRDVKKTCSFIDLECQKIAHLPTESKRCASFQLFSFLVYEFLVTLGDISKIHTKHNKVLTMHIYMHVCVYTHKYSKAVGKAVKHPSLDSFEISDSMLMQLLVCMCQMVSLLLISSFQRVLIMCPF